VNSHPSDGHQPKSPEIHTCACECLSIAANQRTSFSTNSSLFADSQLLLAEKLVLCSQRSLFALLGKKSAEVDYHEILPWSSDLREKIIPGLNRAGQARR